MDIKSFEDYDRCAFTGPPIPGNVNSLPCVIEGKKTYSKSSTYRSFTIPAPWNTQDALLYLDRKSSVIPNKTTPPSFFLHVDSGPCSAERNNSYPTGSGESGVTPPS